MQSAKIQKLWLYSDDSLSLKIDLICQLTCFQGGLFIHPSANLHLLCKLVVMIKCILNMPYLIWDRAEAEYSKLTEPRTTMLPVVVYLKRAN